MQEWLTVIAGLAVTIIHAMALLVVVFGTAQAFVTAVRAMFRRSAAGTDFQTGYIHYARWLVAGLGFQLAADIIETAFSASWDDIGRLAAIAVIRTFVNFFLERDLAELERRESEAHGVGAITKSP